MTPAACGWRSCPARRCSSAASSSSPPGQAHRAVRRAAGRGGRGLVRARAHLSPLWNNHVPLGGSPASPQPFMRVMEQLGFFSALGVVIVLIAGAAIGRILSVPSGIREVEEIPESTATADTVPVDTVRTEDAADPDPDAPRLGQACRGGGDPGRPGPGHHRDRRVRNHPVKPRSARLPLSSAGHI